MIAFNIGIFDFFIAIGRKGVLRGGLDADICSFERYQPWPIKFYTNVSTNCIFRKSGCYEEGQVVYSNGNRNKDNTCRCDYTRSYNFLVKPQNPCFCVPSLEDCSCYLKTCKDSQYGLSPGNFTAFFTIIVQIRSQMFRPSVNPLTIFP